MLKWKKFAHSVSPADKILLYFQSIKIFRVFCQNEEDLLPLFHKMLEGLWLGYRSCLCCDQNMIKSTMRVPSKNAAIILSSRSVNAQTTKYKSGLSFFREGTLIIIDSHTSWCTDNYMYLAVQLS